ncbi:MAG: hypothetical protein BroJett042_27840 [Bacteroidota bacterium]|nr:MAG: hypothetical protein BroJett042_27840 [Bacteroidota bacterium]
MPEFVLIKFKDMKIGSALLLICSVLVSCKLSNDKEKLFAIRHGNELGIDFSNTIVTSDTLGAFSFEYIYNGSGVGVGDFNLDGLPDLFFGGNQVSSQLYLNKGNLQFENVTIKAGLTTNRWVTGVSVVDINQDNRPDIFLAVAGKTSPENMRDLLFINQGVVDGVPVFKEMAKEYGIDDDGYGTMGAFFDYDQDGDLDLYLLTNALESFNRNNLRAKRINGEAPSNDRLYRNNGNNTFTNVTREAGILIEGYGLGVTICDLNNDHWPDVYVSNDFMSNDLIWINQQDGTFKNAAAEYLKHQTHNGMGVDVADFNNDGLADIAVVDMLPPGHKRQKMMTAGQNYDHFHMSQGLGYQPQYMRNTLQLNRGKFADGRVLFSEIAFMSGVSSTDWSWAPLFADFDNDGWKDLFISNGYRKDVTDLDFIFYGSQEIGPFGTTEARRNKFNEQIKNLADVKLTNHIFHNNGSLVFQDKTDEWGINIPTFSNGAVYADLDMDGDLELITNNIDQEVIVYENLSQQQTKKPNYIRLHTNDHTFNEKIQVYAGGNIQFIERTPFRGFQSSVMDDVHFGIGSVATIDSIQIIWRDSVATYKKVPANTVLTYTRHDATPRWIHEKPVQPISFVRQPSPYAHVEKSTSDMKTTRTLLHDLTRYGPCLAAGDVNGDNLDDFFVGGEKGLKARLFIQQPNGTFMSEFITTDSTREDGAAAFLDVDNDGDLDLYVGGSCITSSDSAAVHLLYLNNGKGKFTASTALPEITIPASCVERADYDNDGDLDLFVGGRYQAGKYPAFSRSYILQNNNGTFVDVTAKLNPELEAPGMVTTASWVDIDGDKKMDLVIAGEWMPIRVFKNNGTTFKEVTLEMGLKNTHGWWNCLKVADLNGDGFMDIIAGNTGKNSFFQPTLENPVQMYAKDFDKNGFIDPIVTYYNNQEKERFIVHNRLVLIDQIPGMKLRFQSFKTYASTPFNKAFKPEELEDAKVYEAFSLASCVLVNEAGQRFKKMDLPQIAQISTINDILVEDVNGDHLPDLLLVGNNYSQETMFGAYDASLGTILLNDGALGWKNLEASRSGFLVEKDARYIRPLRTAAGKGYIIGNNNDSLTYFSMQPLPLP